MGILTLFDCFFSGCMCAFLGGSQFVTAEMVGCKISRVRRFRSVLGRLGKSGLGGVCNSIVPSVSAGQR